jgi:hypothetical protein
LAYLAYVRSGAYARRYATDCLRVLTVTTSVARLDNLLRTTQQVAGGDGAARLFWFAALDDVAAETILAAPIWRVPGQDDPTPLLSAQRSETAVCRGVPQLLFSSQP